jgi:hypothetical protein
MLIGFFRKSYFFQYIVLLLLAGAFWIPSFLNPNLPGIDPNPYLTPGYKLLTDLLGSNILISVVFAFLIVVIQALLLNYTLIKNELVPKNTLLPAMVYILLMSHSPGLLHLHPVMLSNLFLILILINLFKIYTKEDAYNEIFNAGFLTAVGSFFYFPLIYFILFIWLTFIVYRLYKWRDWLIPVTGLLTPFIFLFTYFFWSDELYLALDAYSHNFIPPSYVSLFAGFSILDWIIAGIIVLFFLWSFLKLTGGIQEKIILIRKRYGTIFWLLAVCILSYFVSGIRDNSHMAMIAVPVSVYISYGFSHLKRKFWFELLFAVLVLLIVINNLKEFL